MGVPPSPSFPSSSSLWQPAPPPTVHVEVRSDRLWGNTSFAPQVTSELWKKPKPALPAKPDSLRAPGLWRNTSAPPAKGGSKKKNNTKILGQSRRLSRTLSPVSRSSAAPQPASASASAPKARSWIDSVLPSYVGRSTHYRNTHSIWAEQMFKQRRQPTDGNWIDSVLPSYLKSGPYRTTRAVWADKMFAERSQVMIEGSWVESVLPTYVKSGPYETTHASWLSYARANGAAICWAEGMLPSYVSSGPYRTSHDIWEEQTAHLLASRSSQVRQSQSDSAHTNRLPVQHSGKASSFLEHRTSSSDTIATASSGTGSRTVAFHPPGLLSRSDSGFSGCDELSPLANMLSPPEDKQNTFSGLKSPASARFAALQSPCLFHNRFDDAVNLNRVLEEIGAEEGLTSSRLMQTATSVREISKQLQRKPIRRAVRSIMIVTKARDNSLVYLTRDLALWLMGTPRYGNKLGVRVYVDAKLKTSKRFDAAGILAQNPAYADMLRYWNPDLCWSKPESFDLVLTLGGDGTVLFTSFSLFQRVVPPVLAFGLGSLGFLTPFKFQEYKTSLNKVLGDDGMRVNLRMRFTCTVFRAPQHVDGKGSRARKSLHAAADTSQMVEGEQFEVLNELVIDRGPSPYVSNLELYADDSLLTVVQADGCIFSTPTGSTAYSLSAGGPLTQPNIPGLVLTPICPHTLSFRPMVLSDSICLKVCIPRDSRSTAYASFDGKHRVELRRGDCVRIEAGRYPFPTVVGDEGTANEWFNSVRRALRWNTRGAMQKGFTASAKVPTQPSNSRFEEIAEQSEDDLPQIKVPGGKYDENDDDDDDVDEEDETEEETEWDIDFEPLKEEPGTSTGVSVIDSGIGLSEAGSQYSPTKKNSVAGLLPERGAAKAGY